MEHSFVFVVSTIIVNGCYPFVICELNGCDVICVWYVKYGPFVCVDMSVYPNN